MDFIFGIRAVIEAILAGRAIDKILIKRDLHSDLAPELFALIKERHLVAQRVPAEKLDRITRKNHQGVVAYLSAIDYCPLGTLVPQLFEAGKMPLIVVMDGITDVRNFGAIARTAECAGVDALVIPERGSVGVGADAIKTSAGALSHIPVCREHTTLSAVRYLKDSGFNVVAVSEKADMNYTEGNYTVPTALVMGAEDVGISTEVLAQCQTWVSIPMFGRIGSLNVSVAAGVLMYEAVRQRLNANQQII